DASLIPGEDDAAVVEHAERLCVGAANFAAAAEIDRIAIGRTVAVEALTPDDVERGRGDWAVRGFPGDEEIAVIELNDGGEVALARRRGVDCDDRAGHEIPAAVQREGAEINGACVRRWRCLGVDPRGDKAAGVQRANIAQDQEVVDLVERVAVLRGWKRA